MAAVHGLHAHQDDLFRTNYIEILEGGLDREERRIYNDLLEHDDAFAERFLAQLPYARRGIMHRLLQGILRENLLGLGQQVQDHGHYLSEWHTRTETMLHQIRARGENFLYAKIVPLSESTTWIAPVKNLSSFDRFEPDGDVWIGEQTGPVTNTRRLRHPIELLISIQDKLTAQQAEAPNFTRFCEEIQNSVANFALALAGYTARQTATREDARRHGLDTTLDYVRHLQQESATFSPLVFFEQLVVEGHPLHPGAKIKMGMTTADTLRYSPEHGARPQVRLVAVRNDHVGRSAQGNLTTNHLLYQDYPDLQAQVQAGLHAKNQREEDYQLVTLHPWQYEHTVMAGTYDAELAADIIVPIEGVALDTGALMSFRSLAPSGKQRHHIKTCVNIQMTGAIRTISPNSAQNGPRIATLITEILERENRFGNTLYVMQEKVGVHFKSNDPTESEADRFFRAKNLATIIRENPEWYADEDELALVGSSLIAASPLSGRPIALELIDEYAREHGIEEEALAVSEWFKAYVSTLLPGFLTLMSRYGISLEGHLQNSVPVFKNGRLTKMIVRDFGGVRIHRDRIRRQGLSLEEYPGSATIIDDDQDLRNKTFYPLFQNHLGELIFTLANHTSCKERVLWDHCLALSYGIYKKLAADEVIRDQAMTDRTELFAPSIELKSMTTMRLLGTVTDYTFSRVTNPLDPKGRIEAVEHDNEQESVFIKYACCKKFSLPDKGRCTGCPGLCQHERQERLYARLGVEAPEGLPQGEERCLPDTECTVYVGGSHQNCRVSEQKGL
ncbi:MAG TPA: IucA/IucC family protein [Bacilli bacterium]|nr:IucA/IucC family protein [Bacilli bacterium]